MKKQSLLLLIMSVILCACGDSSDPMGFPVPQPPDSNSGLTDGPQSLEFEEPDDPSVAASECVSVPSAPFLKRVHGFWQRHQETTHQPACFRESGTNQIVRSFISFNFAQKSYHAFRVGYGTHFEGASACLTAPVGVGTPLSPVEPLAVELCQTEELISALGREYYFEKTHGLYRLVGSTQDTKGRVVLLISNLRSSTPQIAKWLATPRPVFPYINHNDFKSVQLREMRL